MKKPKRRIIILKDPIAVAIYAADRFTEISALAEKENRIMNVSLSGGNTPALLFKILSSETYNKKIKWQNIHLWWGDERTVSPDDPDSNFGNTDRLLLKDIDIPFKNIHRIKGELDPHNAAIAYQKEMIRHLPLLNGTPILDWTILGMGDDGHTASLFYIDQTFRSDDLTAVTLHPETGQKRISLTPKALCPSKHISFLVTGKNKAEIISKILGNESSKSYPASLIRSENGKTEWVIDENAGSLLQYNL